MSLFGRKKGPVDQSPIEIDGSIQGYGAKSLQENGQLVGGAVLSLEVPALEEAVDVSKLIQFSDRYLEALGNFDTIVDRASLKDTLSTIGEGGTFTPEDGSGRTFRKRKLNQEEQDALLLASVSARVAANKDIDERDHPYLLSYDRTDFDYEDPSAQESLHVFSNLRNLAENLEVESRNIETSIEMTLYPIAEFLKNGDVDSFLVWIRNISDDEQMHGVLKIIAQDVHDKSRGKILRAIEDRVSAMDDTETKARFADVLQHQDGEYTDELEILDFAVSALSHGRLSADYTQLLTTVDKSLWPKALADAYNDYRNRRSKEVIGELQNFTLPFFEKNRRRPSIEELRKLEFAMIDSPEEMSQAEKLGRPIKKARAKVSTDFISPTSSDEVVTPKKTSISRIATTLTARERKVETIEGTQEQHTEALIQDFIKTYRLDANQARIARSDLEKMFDALKINATRNFGVTKISEIKPFKDAKGQPHTVWRLNPAHYNGLSVSRSGKDTRILYTISNGGTIGVLGIYNHDDYERAIKSLR